MYKLIKSEEREEIVINKSRFIGTGFLCEDESAAKAKIEAIRKEFRDATHNCYAYVFDSLGNAMKFSDDGEPQGTAGMPILEVLKNKKLVLSGVVVTRYFGGIKLGAGGLVRAYTDCAVKTLDKCGVVVMTEAVELELSVEYPAAKATERFLRDYVVSETSYAERVTYKVICKKDEVKALEAGFTELTLGRGVCKAVRERYYAFENQIW